MRRQGRWNEGVHVDAARLLHPRRDSLRGSRRLLERLRSELHLQERLHRLPASERDMHVDDCSVSVHVHAWQPEFDELLMSVTRSALVVYAVTDVRPGVALQERV